MSNLELWDKLAKTNPKHTKPFKRAGGFSGTSIKPMYAYQRVTEEFGPCGLGWGMGEPSFQVVQGSDGEVLVFCTVSVWYNHPRESGPHHVFGVGGDKVVVKQSNGLRGDDEAFKKAYTDAVMNGLKMIGVGADIHMGMHDDNKYVNSLQNEFSEEPKPPAQEPKQSQPDSKRMGKTEEARKLFKSVQDDLKKTASHGPDAITALMNSDEMVADLARLPEDYEKTLRDDARALYRAAKTFFDENTDAKQVDAQAYLREHFPGSLEMKGN